MKTLGFSSAKLKYAVGCIFWQKQCSVHEAWAMGFLFFSFSLSSTPSLSLSPHRSQIWNVCRCATQSCLTINSVLLLLCSSIRYIVYGTHGWMMVNSAPILCVCVCARSQFSEWIHEMYPGCSNRCAYYSGLCNRFDSNIKVVVTVAGAEFGQLHFIYYEWMNWINKQNKKRVQWKMIEQKEETRMKRNCNGWLGKFSYIIDK